LIAAREEAEGVAENSVLGIRPGPTVQITTSTRSGAWRQDLSMSREAVQNLNQHIRVGTAHDGAESCSSKTLRWTAGMRKNRTFPTTNEWVKSDRGPHQWLAHAGGEEHSAALGD
jgi:hypothetical protein